MSVKFWIAALVAALSISTAFAADAPTTADVDAARLTEYSAIFGGAVMGYTANDRQVRMGGEGHGMAMGDHAMAKGDMHMAEGMRCGVAGHHSGCGCKPSCCWRDGWYDCWGVWQTDDMYDFAAIRESDYDPVMGRGDTGRGWFW